MRNLRKELKGSFGDPHITCNISLSNDIHGAFLEEVMANNITVNMMIKFLIMLRYGYIKDFGDPEAEEPSPADIEVADIEKQLDESHNDPSELTDRTDTKMPW